MEHTHLAIADAIRRTIARVEQANPNDPRVAELRRRALLRLADLQERSRKRRAKLLVLQPSKE